jgi:SAM-dependent methyltransferase
VSHRTPAFARDRATHAYYERRAEQYDDWYEGTGRFADRDRPGWAEEREQIVDVLGALEPARTLDVACGTAYLSRHLRGFVVGVDQSRGMVEIARDRLPSGEVLLGDGVDLPVRARAFDRVFTGHFYGHLDGEERAGFIEAVRRVAPELVVVDAALRPGVPPAEWQVRTLDDGSEHEVYKRYLTPDDLHAELGAEILFAGTWFIASRTRW